jgi:hypothetical protein
MSKRIVFADNGELEERIHVARGQGLDEQFFAVRFRTYIPGERQKNPEEFIVHFNKKINLKKQIIKFAFQNMLSTITITTVRG